MAFNGLMMLGCALLLRPAASNIRDAALEELESLQVELTEGKHACLPTGSDTAKKYNKSLALTIREIRNIRTGAYAPWPADLAVIATLVPTGGAGLITILQMLLE